MFYHTPIFKVDTGATLDVMKTTSEQSRYKPAHKKGPNGFPVYGSSNTHAHFPILLPEVTSRSLVHVCEQPRLWRVH